MWNPSLVSGDVGVGINVRRLRRDFLRYLSFSKSSFLFYVSFCYYELLVRPCFCGISCNIHMLLSLFLRLLLSLSCC